MSSHVRPSGTLGMLRKRKDRGPLDPPPRTQPASKPGPPAHSPDPVYQPAQPVIGSGILLMGGYLAHEFLAKGTLFGKPWEPPPRPGEAAGKPTNMPPPPPPPPPKRVQTVEAGQVKPGVSQTYLEVSQLLMCTNGAHIPGIVNPTQLARWLHK